MKCERCKCVTFVIYLGDLKLCEDCRMSNLNKEQFRFTYLTSLLIGYAYAKGYTLTYGDAWAKSGHKVGSKHYSRLAIDLNLFKDGNYLAESEDHKPLGEFWESLDPLCVWGGSFSNKDGNHYQYTHG